MLGAIIGFFKNPIVLDVIRFVYKSSIVWFPLLCLFILWEYWIRYVRGLFLAKQNVVLLEIKLPREIFKSPRAAEFFIAGLNQVIGEGNWYEKYWKGQVRSHFSLEIVSIGGSVHFFVWTKKGHQSSIEANLYSQYPGVEVHEVPDYTLPIAYDTDKYSFWGTEYDLTREDVFPIKTYIDYGMDKDPKEEFKIDPLTPLLEFLGGLQPKHQVWIQIFVRSHKNESKDPVTGKMVDTRWKEDAQVQIDKILAKTKGEKGEDGKIIPGSTRQLTEVEHETVKAIGRSVSKTPFDVGMRSIYIAEKDVFNLSNVGGMIGAITHFNSHLNGFKPARGSAERYGNFFLVWKKRSERKRDMERSNLLNAYKRRAYYYAPFRSPHFILNSEELATIFHFPGQVAATSSFTRIDSRKAEAPANLPI